MPHVSGRDATPFCSKTIQRLTLDPAGHPPAPFSKFYFPLPIDRVRVLQMDCVALLAALRSVGHTPIPDRSIRLAVGRLSLHRESANCTRAPCNRHPATHKETYGKSEFL